jgi:hypothetical protein
MLAFLVIATALPFAIVYTIETGRMYLFSRQFLEESPQRFTGLRFILRPTVAIARGIRAALADAKGAIRRTCSGCFSVLNVDENCYEVGWGPFAITSPWGLSWTSVIYRSVHPGAAVVIGPILICFPYALSKALTRMSRFIPGQLEVVARAVLSFWPTAATTNPAKPLKP